MRCVAWVAAAALALQAPGLEQQAYRAYQQRDWAGAARLYEEFHAAASGSPSSYDNLGVALINLGRWGAAEQALRKAIDLDPRHRWAYNHLGFVYREQGRHDDAIGMFRRQIEIGPKDPYAYRNLAGTLVLLGRLEEAERIAEDHERLTYERGAVYIDMACNLHGRNQPEPARKFLEKAAAAGAERSLLAQEWAHHYLLARDFRRAEQQYLKLAEYRPFDPSVALRLGALYFNTGNLEKAARAFGRAVTSDARDQVGELPADLRQAALLVRMDQRRDTAGFVTACEDLLAAGLPAEAEAAVREELGWSLFQDGRPAAAVAELENALRLAPGRRLAAYRLGAALEASAGAERALELYTRSLEPLPETAIDCGCEQPDLAARELIARELFTRLKGPDADFAAYRRSLSH